MPKVARALGERIDVLREGLARLPGIELLGDARPERRAGILTFRIGDGEQSGHFEALKQAQVVCALRGGGIRLSPHFYTPQRVLDETLDLVRGMARR